MCSVVHLRVSLSSQVLKKKVKEITKLTMDIHINNDSLLKQLLIPF